MAKPVKITSHLLTDPTYLQMQKHAEKMSEQLAKRMEESILEILHYEETMEVPWPSAPTQIR